MEMKIDVVRWIEGIIESDVMCTEILDGRVCIRLWPLGVWIKSTRFFYAFSHRDKKKLICFFFII